MHCNRGKAFLSALEGLKLGNLWELGNRRCAVPMYPHAHGAGQGGREGAKFNMIRWWTLAQSYLCITIRHVSLAARSGRGSLRRLGQGRSDLCVRVQRRDCCQTFSQPCPCPCSCPCGHHSVPLFLLHADGGWGVINGQMNERDETPSGAEIPG